MSELLDGSRSTFEWGELSPQRDYPHTFYRWVDGLGEAGLKKYWPKEWAKKFGGLKRGKIYTYNVVKGSEGDGFKSGDRVKLLYMRPELMMHVEVELQDKNKSTVGLVHVCCLMLDGGMDNKGV